ncbi:precorrin-3B synthase [Nocardiopsis mangrovi]|uniref:Precorrin-3B synthase n=1 Tax=Nocardiopsis mangrovi TaxID=1179818 RepID=A0ABV9DZM7_9ACTN
MPPSPGSPRRGAPAAGRTRRDREDACPGALRLHAAHDGGLARVRIPGGVLTAAQARALAAAAEDLGDGHLDLTSRGNVQLRGLDDDAGGALADRLEAAGLLPSRRHERVRNIVASPLSGLDGQGHADMRPHVARLDALLCASDVTPALSGRFLFALDDGRGDTAALGADITVTARPGAAADLRIGTGTLRVPRDDAARWAVRAAEAFLDLARESGAAAWRVADVDPDGRAIAARLALPPAAGVPQREEGGLALPGGGTAASQPRLGRIDRPDSAYAALSVAAPLGRAAAAQWRHLAAAAASAAAAQHAGHGSGELRVTPWRGVVLPGLDRATAADVLAVLADAGLVTSDDSPWVGVTACTGRPGCASSLADVRADAAAVLRSHPVAPRQGRRPVHWSGCERRCGRPSGRRWVDAVANGDGGYRITVHGVDPAATESAPGADPVEAQAPRGAGPAETDAAHGGLGAAVAAARTTRPPREM